MNQPIPVGFPVGARSKGWVCYHSLAGIVDSNPAKGTDVCLVSVMCFQVEIPATGRSLVQRRPTVCGVSLIMIRCNNNHVHVQ